MKSRRSHLFVATLLGAALLILTFNTMLSLRSVQALTLSQYWVDHTWRVIYGLQQVSESLNDAGTSTQQYLLSGDVGELGSYKAAILALPAQLDQVAGLITDNPAQQRALAGLREEITKDQVMLESRILQHPPVRGSAEKSTLSVADLAQIRHGRTSVAKMQATEEGLLAERTAGVQQDKRRAEGTALFAGVIDLLLILLVFRSFAIERRLREHGEETTERLQKLESISDVTLSRLPIGDLNQELLERLLRLLRADTVLLLTERDGKMAIAAGAGKGPPPGTPIPITHSGPLSRALRGEGVIALPDTAVDPLPLEGFQEHLRSVLIAPLPNSPSLSGLIVAGRQSAQPFESGDQEILSVAAGRIGIALDRANVYEAERQARRQAEASAEQVRQLNAELEDRVSQRTLELEESNRELEAFSYSVSHDLRAPLRTIDGFSLVLLEDYGDSLDGNANDYLRRIRDGVQRMGSLIDSLLHLSRITRAELLEETVDLSAMARAVAGELTMQNLNRSIMFNIQAGLECKGDSRLLRAALENLMGNAVKFTARREQAHIEFGRSGNAYFIRDNGVGFDSRYMHKLFNAFNRLHGDKDFRGSGIGLATVARIIRRHQGRVWAESVEGQGATFWFQLG